MDDLQSIWSKNQPTAPDLSEELRRARLGRISRSTSRLRLRLWLEAGFVLLALAAILFAWQTGMVYKSRTVLWMIAAAAITALPILYRLARAIAGFSQLDYSKNVVENLRSVLASIQRELRFYLWSLYLFTIVMTGLILIDPFSFWKKAALLGFLFINALMGKHWVRLLYGKELDRLEAELKSWEPDI